MQCGLYGKLPTKRDFIAIKAPREFLDVWEPWMQGGLSASRHALGDNWQQTFLTAPIWRFWLGSELCGRTMLGAFMFNGALVDLQPMLGVSRGAARDNHERRCRRRLAA